MCDGSILRLHFLALHLQPLTRNNSCRVSRQFVNLLVLFVCDRRPVRPRVDAARNRVPRPATD
jgi:hypothetical protein